MARRQDWRRGRRDGEMAGLEVGIPFLHYARCRANYTGRLGSRARYAPSEIWQTLTRRIRQARVRARTIRAKARKRVCAHDATPPNVTRKHYVEATQRNASERESKMVVVNVNVSRIDDTPEQYIATVTTTMGVESYAFPTAREAIVFVARYFTRHSERLISYSCFE